ncbi:glycosyltransferase family 39 protein [Ferrovibrio sp.]|uniref:glycosyltransferase family 39 protein n=1 Tax=Ferrovibrio sp. TaxID=1917215 RepID=UPI00351734B1
MNRMSGWQAVLPGLMVLQLAGWTLVPYFALPNAPLDVIEGAIWGHQFQWGYHKGPPLFAWMVGIGTELFPGSLLPALLCSQLSIVIAYWAIGRLAGRFLPPRDAAIALLATAVVYHFGYPTPEFNPIILQIAFSALAISFFFTAATEERMTDWAVFGLVAGLGMLSRYSVAIHLLAIGIFALWTPEIRRQWRSPGPYLAVAIGTGILLPHLVWLVSTDFISVKYIDQRSGHLDGLPRIIEPVRFMISQLFAALPAILLLGLTIFLRPRTPCADQPPAGRIAVLARRYLLLVAAAPVPFVAASAILSGRELRDMWGAPLWLAAPLLAVLLIRHRISNHGARRALGIWPVLYATPLLVFAVAVTWGPQILHRNKRVTFPGEALAQEITGRFRQQTGLPLRYVVGDLWLAGNITFYSPDQPQAFTEGDVQRAPWIDLVQLRHCGAVVVWQPALTGGSMPASYQALFPQLIQQPAFALTPPPRAVPDTRFQIDWAIVTPKSGQISGSDRDCPLIPERTPEE